MVLAPLRTQRGRFARCALLFCLIVLALAPVARAACTLTRVTDMPVSDNGGFLTVRASLNGRPASWILDTGASSGLVTEEAAMAFGLPLDRRRLTQMQGTGGDGGWSRNVILDQLDLGGLAIGTLSVPVNPLPGMPRINPPVIGLIGADLLSLFELDIDIRHGRLTLYRLNQDLSADPGCSALRPSGWEGPFDTLPLSRSENRLLVGVQLDQRPMTALIDTGARSIIVGMKAAAAVGVSAADIAAEPGGITGGVDMREVLFHWHRFASLRVGSDVMLKPVLTVSPLQEEADILLGSNWFADRRVWLSFGTGRMFVQAAVATQ